MKNEVFKYQFFAKLNSSILIANLPALLTSTKHTNPLKLRLIHSTAHLHLVTLTIIFSYFYSWLLKYTRIYLVLCYICNCFLSFCAVSKCFLSNTFVTEENKYQLDAYFWLTTPAPTSMRIYKTLSHVSAFSTLAIQPTHTVNIGVRGQVVLFLCFILVFLFPLLINILIFIVDFTCIWKYSFYLCIYWSEIYTNTIHNNEA